jgi:predicted nucleic acid-binding protein
LIVLDASAAIEWLLQSRTGSRIEERIFSGTTSLHAPHLLDLEVAQVLRRLAAGGSVGTKRAAQAIEDLADLSITRYAHNLLLFRIWELRHNLSAYDSAYIALAELLDAPLITCDRRLGKTPGLWLQIELY